MVRYNFLPLIAFASFFALFVLLVHAQDQSDFVSIDCGIPNGSSYNDETTDIKYVSDAAFVESGTIHSIDPKFETSSLEKQFQNVRSFPQGKRNCYDVQPTQGKGSMYLIRTRFMYGNYDSLGKAPDFDLYLGANLWDSVIIDNATTIVTKEIIHTLRSDRVHVCLVDKDKGTPFLSVLELRLLKSDIYETPYESIMLYRRWDLGALGDVPIRYKDDMYDRMWMPVTFSNYRVLSTNLTIESDITAFQPPRVIMSTASTALNASLDLGIFWKPVIPSWKFYVYMYFAEVEEIPSNETREFSVIWNDKIMYDNFSPRFLHTDRLYTQIPVTGPIHDFVFKRTAKSTLPPIINAMEMYRVNEFLQSPTDQQNVDAIMRIKSKYGVKKNWLGDPCAPVNYPWKDINCSYVDDESPKIISLNLSLSGLTGEIDPAFSNLTSIQKLDISNNSLTGKVPDFLGNLHNLTELNLEGNKLTGALPVKLLERSRSGSLSLRLGGNPDLCVSASCQIPDLKTKKGVYIIALVASIVGVLVLVIALALFLLFKKRRRNGGPSSIRSGPLDTTKRYYKYAEVVKVTNNFERVLGQGGFGKVYYGVLNDDQVAVKMLSESSAQGYKEFRAEVELLLRVHHKNLTALIGYCNEVEGKKMALIYEFMANGTLGDYLSGLEYLHNGCKPPIVQRDVKPANILINEKLQAKIADFGLSRSVALDGKNQETTAVAGTIGYLDPEYHSTQKLSEKSDVYSFGVVLLEVVTGQPVISRSTTAAENIHITDQVELLLSRGDIKRIVDPQLGKRFDAGSAWKITELAMACASPSSKNRPTMSQVVAELKESVSRARAGGDSSSSTSFTEPAMTTYESGMFPQASFFAVLVLLVHAQDQSGFVSIDCGIPDDSSYNDETTDIKYISDAAFVESGTIQSIDTKFQTSSLEKQFQNVRSFPEGKRNCYDVQPPRGKGFKYLIRTRFMYGNYDNLGKAPEFDLYLGVNIWDSVIIDNATTIVTKEIIYTLRSDRVHVCLVDKGRGTPFLSALELRLLKSDTYETHYSSMMLFKRWDLGGLGNLPVRYKDDVYDRIWIPLRFPRYTIFNASLTIDTNTNNGFQPARFVMNTATSPEDLSQDIILKWEPLDPTWKYYVYMHFAEVVELPSNETREFTVLLNEKSINMTVFSPRYLYTDTLFVQNPVSGPKLEFRLKSSAKSTLPPIINAIETYRVNEFLQSPTDQQDVDAIVRIKSKYGVKKNWLGDPCAPKFYPWKDINCSYVDNEPLRIVSVNLSLSGLTGEIDPAFSNLTLIQKLDLSNNSLTGKVPDFLGNLHNLTELNLEGNKLTGDLPVKLLERSKNGSLLLRYGGNPDLCVSASCKITDDKTKKSVYIIPLIASVAGVLGLVIVVALFLQFKKRLRSGGSGGTGPLDTTKRYYKYSEVVKITNNFERVLGQGGFGKVYHGVLNDDQVAVKILSESSTQGYKEFRAEVEILLRVHHKNLTALIGYCHEVKGMKMALIYEFMANGTLGDYLSGKKSYVLSWEERLQISLDSAQGLEYLHSGCKPPIVQRDVKPANILINESLQAKIADFGLSRSVALDGKNQDSTAVAGTIGYLDPEYHSTRKLSEKSDVYSFGVVLLEVVTGQPVIVRSRTTAENKHITDRVGELLSTGNIRGIVDPKLGGRFDAGSAWKITEVAMACASSSSKNRPTMSQVVAELKESVSKARASGGYSGTSSSFTTEPAMTSSDSGMFPQAR
ncbi:hypothetical protein AALP_AA3G355900 [Arabis alpina]|uniref:non-specific serine/threonine protein kinase n=1 Tax=Arabis alpina TaxID=50452 RepID=A0A087HDT7_ARAAL|nr:hypothetical protein AALP_AA3G355900 [Arabis alpina]